jgi:hypothetical protein
MWEENATRCTVVEFLRPQVRLPCAFAVAARQGLLGQCPSLIASLSESYEGALEITFLHLPRQVKHLSRVGPGMIRAAQTRKENRLERALAARET